MQGRKGLRRHPTSQHQGESGYQHGLEEQVFSVRFHWLVFADRN
jgi:hypothetical protein